MSTRVLLVDDDVSLSETLEIGLRKRGYEVVTRYAFTRTRDVG